MRENCGEAGGDERVGLRADRHHDREAGQRQERQRPGAGHRVERRCGAPPSAGWRRSPPRRRGSRRRAAGRAARWPPARPAAAPGRRPAGGPGRAARRGRYGPTPAPRRSPRAGWRAKRASTTCGPARERHRRRHQHHGVDGRRGQQEGERGRRASRRGPPAARRSAPSRTRIPAARPRPRPPPGPPAPAGEAGPWGRKPAGTRAATAALMVTPSTRNGMACTAIATKTVAQWATAGRSSRPLQRSGAGRRRPPPPGRRRPRRHPTGIARGDGHAVPADAYRWWKRRPTSRTIEHASPGRVPGDTRHFTFAICRAYGRCRRARTAREREGGMTRTLAAELGGAVGAWRRSRSAWCLPRRWPRRGQAATDAVTISGARSLSDRVTVELRPNRTGNRTTDVHLLAFNDLHGNLEAGGQQHLWQVRRRRRLPGQGGQGPPGAVRRPAGDRLRRRQHRRQPARQRAVLRGADHHRQQPDERRLRDRSATTSSTRARTSCSASRTAAASRSTAAPPRPYALPERRDHQRLPGRRLPVPVGQRGRRRHRQDAVPRLRHQDVRDRPGTGRSRSASSARCWRRRPPSSPPPGSPG